MQVTGIPRGINLSLSARCSQDDAGLRADWKLKTSDVVEAREMMGLLKKILIVLIAAFVLFYLFTRPEDAAEAVRTFFGAFEAIGRFFSSLVA